VQDHADEAEDVVDRRRRRRLAEGREQVERPHVGLEARRLPRREIPVVQAQLPGLAQDVVVDVGDVAHAVGLVAKVT
jgi:hypothetical protein